MRWGAGRDELGPVHWVVAFANGDVIPCTVLGKQTDRYTQGHRFPHPSKDCLAFARDYETVLKLPVVIPDFAARRSSIEEQVRALCQSQRGNCCY